MQGPSHSGVGQRDFKIALFWYRFYFKF